MVKGNQCSAFLCLSTECARKRNEVTVGVRGGGISFSDDGVGEGINCYEKRHLDAMKQEFFWGRGYYLI